MPFHQSLSLLVKFTLLGSDGRILVLLVFRHQVILCVWSSDMSLVHCRHKLIECLSINYWKVYKLSAGTLKDTNLAVCMFLCTVYIFPSFSHHLIPITYVICSISCLGPALAFNNKLDKLLDIVVIVILYVMHLDLDLRLESHGRILFTIAENVWVHILVEYL